MSPVPSSSPAAFTVPEAARQLSICRATVYRMIGAGEIRSVKIRNAVRIPRTEIERLLQSDAA